MALVDSFLPKVTGWTALDGATNVARQQESLITVVARQHYVEWEKRYPVVSKVELKQILNAEQIEKGVYLYAISEPENRNRTVRCWFISAEIADKYPKSLFWLPESWLFRKYLERSAVLRVVSNLGSYFVSEQRGVIRSVAETPVLNVHTVCSSWGIADLEPFEVHNDIHQSFDDLRSLRWNDWLNGFCFRPGLFAGRSLRRLSIVFGVTLGIYMAGSTTYLLAAQSFYQDKISQSKNDRLDGLLQKQLESQNIQQQLAISSEILSEKKYSFPVWKLISELLSKNVDLMNMRFQDGKWTFRGRADSATRVLQFVRTHEVVQQAEFESAVTREEGKESFVLAVVVK